MVLVLKGIFEDEVCTKPAKNGWSPGWYWRTCCRCDITFAGHKRSYECVTCGYDEDIQRKITFELTQQKIAGINKEIYRLIARRGELELELVQK